MGDELVRFKLGGYAAALQRGLEALEEEDTLTRFWAQDHTIWKSEPDEIANRLGWLHVPAEMKEAAAELEGFADDIRKSGYTFAVLLGMGGSSLAAEVFASAFRKANPLLDLIVLDSTNPQVILNVLQKIDIKNTVFLVSTKSGSTVETLSLFKFMFSKITDAVGGEVAGRHFVAVTDPGSSLEKLAKELGFNRIFLNNPHIGGRYSALSYFGLVPAALMGVDIDALLERALAAVRACGAQSSVAENPAARLGAALGELAKEGRDKCTFIISPQVESFGDWVEQLIAESTGKEGKGILPIVGEELAAPQSYGNDRVFIWLHMRDQERSAALEALAEAGHPLIEIPMDDVYDIGGQFFLWEMATALAGQRLRINPFDQPNVESAKVKARAMVAAYREQGQLPAEMPLLEEEGIEVYSTDITCTEAEKGKRSLRDVFQSYLGVANAGSYVALQAYLPDTDGMRHALSALRHRLRDRSGLATTLGFGPRFLHSTGQLHKGDDGRGLFIQITSEVDDDLAIPDEAGGEDSSISFGILLQAQALGDMQALREKGRQVIRFHLKGDLQAGMRMLAKVLEL